MNFYSVLCYTEAMNTKRITSQLIRLGKIGIKVYVTGDTPRIRKGRFSAETPKNLKGIHTHFTYEIFFVTTGKLKLVTEDFSKTYEQSVLIIPPHMKHYSFPDSESCFCLLFSFEEPAAAAELIQQLEERITEFPITEEITFYIRNLASKSALATQTAERDCNFLTALLFDEILEKLTPSKADSQSFGNTASEHISAIERFINSNIGRKITLSDVARQVFLSTKQISRIIEKEYGTSFSQLVTDKRLARAEMLLKNTDMKIAEIAEETFPGTETYFFTLFKKKYSMTPLQYRKELRNAMLFDKSC